MTAHGLRWVLAALLAGLWLASLSGVVPLGPLAHLLAVTAAALAIYQLRHHPESSAFELWQQKQQAIKPKPTPRRAWGSR